MKIFKRVVALATAATVLIAPSFAFPGVAFASSEDASQILQDAARNATGVTAMHMVGDVQGAVDVDPGPLAEVVAVEFELDFDLTFGFDLSTNIFKFYMQMVGAALEVSTGFEETVDIGMFMENETLLLNIDGEWMNFSDPAVAGEFATFGDLGPLFELSEEISADLYALLPAAFSDVEEDGYYVIDVVINNDNIAEIATAFVERFLDPEFIDEFLAVLGTEDLGLTEEELAIVMEQLPMLMELLESLDIEFEILYRSFIDTETRNWQRYSFDINATVTLDMGFFGVLNVDIDILSNFEVISTDPDEIEWPEFDLDAIPAFPMP
ncbi:MAG: hypothetical protein FWG63_06300 [Defluviitaleaceae bacterium]|nr:hypothetical protein [Defluviitaleaceae bacterium]